MNLDATLLCQILNAKSPELLKALDPSFSFKKKAISLLDETYHNINLLEKIDPSHFESFYASYPKKDILMVKTVLKSQDNSMLSHFITQDCLAKLLKLMPCLPYQYMPAFEASSILFLKSAHVQQLTFLLGIYDLKQATKTIIDQELLKQITSCLSDLQKLFLKELSKEKDKVAFKRLPLESWDRQKSSLDDLLYLRGLNRLAKAFSSYDDFIKNEVILRLPVKDKQQFIALCTKIEPNIKEALCFEIEHAISFMKKNLNFNF